MHHFFMKAVETGGRNERCISESNLFAVNSFNAKSELFPSSGDNGAVGSRDIHIQG